MLPLDGYLKPLHHTLETVLRGFASITNHPDRRHQHKYYTSILQDIEIWILDEAVPSCDPKAVSSSSTNPKLAVQPSRNLFSWSQIRVPLNQTAPTGVDANDVYALLNALPMLSTGSKQNYNVWVSMFFAFSRTGVTCDSYWLKQPRSRKNYQKRQWEICKQLEKGYGINMIRKVLSHIGVRFLDAVDQRVADATRLDKQQNRQPLEVTLDN